MACLSVAVRLSRILLGVQVVMSSLTASKNVLSARSLSLGGYKYFCYIKECHLCLRWKCCCYCQKNSRMRREKS